MRSISYISCSLALLASPVWCADLVVAPPSSIQAAIDASSDGDRVLLQPGTYVEHVQLAGKAIQLIGIGGSDVTILDGGGGGATLSFFSGEGVTTRVTGLSITGGSNSGVACSLGATPVLEDCKIYGNSGQTGGGVHGSPVLLRCEIFNNHASSGSGGGVKGAPRMEGCVIHSNSLTGGAGGGVYLIGGAAVLRDCEVVDNQAVFGHGRGGGVYVDSSATALLQRCTIARNHGSAGVFAALGGGLFVESIGTQVIGCTFVSNTLFGSSELGGAVYGPATLRNCVVRGNDAPQLSSVGQVTYCDVEGGAAGVGNIDIDPSFVALSSGDYHLLPGSPCINAGDPADPRDADGSVVDMGSLPFDLPGPETFCTPLPNSTGAGAHISWSGTTSLTSNDFVLHAVGLPPGQPGVFYYGPERTLVPFADGLRCVGAGSLGLFRLNPPQASGAGGTTMRQLDVTAAPAVSGPGAIHPGTTWTFQLWYRDPAAGMSGSNTTDALTASFAL